MNKLNICIIGLGGVGGYFGGKLAHRFSSSSDPSVNVFFVARGKHLAAIKENGLIVKSPEFGRITCKPTLATDRISELPPIDFLLEERDLKARFRRGGGRTKGPRKRTPEDDRRFEPSLEKVFFEK